MSLIFKGKQLSLLITITTFITIYELTYTRNDVFTIPHITQKIQELPA